MISVTYGYVYVATPMTSTQAQAYCVNEYNSNLATVQRDDRTQANNDIVLSGRETWIGLYSNGLHGNFIWRNQDECEFPSPGTCVDFWGTPEDGYGINVPLCVKDGSGNKCVYYLEDTELVYNDLDCEEERPFLCQEDNSPPDTTEGISFIGSCNTGGCQIQSDNVCGQDGYIKYTLTCNENDLPFDETTDAIQSCIDIPESIIPAGVTVTDVIVSTSFQHTWVGDLDVLLQKDGALTSTLISQGTCGSRDNVDVILRYIIFHIFLLYLW